MSTLNVGKKWFNNGKVEEMIDPNQAPDGWVKGRLRIKDVEKKEVPEEKRWKTRRPVRKS